MTGRVILIVAMMVAAWLGTSSRADALPSTCFVPPLPAIVQSPTFTMDVFFGGEHGRLDVWRQACQDGSGELAVLVRVTPITPKVFVCSLDFSITQFGVEFDARATTTTSAAGAPQFCADVTSPTVLLLFESPGAPDFRERASFTLTYNGSPLTSTAVPAPTVVVTATGCTDCGAGNPIGFTAHVTNGGPPIAVELKTGIRLPDGTSLSLGDYTQVLPAGADIDVPLVPSTVTPAGVPPGTYVVEAALLEPILGINWTRSSVKVTFH